MKSLRHFQRFSSNFRRPTTVHSIANVDILREKYFPGNDSEGSECCPAFSILRKEILLKNRLLNIVHVDAIIIGMMNSSKHLPIAKKYLDFLKSQNISPSKLILGKLLKLYHLASKEQELRDEDKDELLKIYTKIRSEHEYVDSSLCESLIQGIIVTNRWKEALDLMDQCKLSAIPSATTYSLIIARAFQDFDSFEIGWSLLEEMVENKREPKCESFIAYLNKISTNSETFYSHLEDLFMFLNRTGIYVSRNVILLLRKTLDNFKIKNFVTEITKHGKCEICQKKLETLSLSSIEFNNLKKHFLDNVLIRKDVFQKSNPQEVSLFLKHIENSSYDCVIDGLNVAYSTGLNKSPKVYANQIASVLKYFKAQKKKVLVIGRKHMLKWKGREMDFVKNNSDIFFTNDLTHDDPFLLYAALSSGKNTDFFSRDLMRSHSYLLGNELKAIFKRWQQIHQYSLVTASSGNVIIKKPTPYNTSAHKIISDSLWHIPFREKFLSNPPETLGNPDSWLCIKFQ